MCHWLNPVKTLDRREKLHAYSQQSKITNKCYESEVSHSTTFHFVVGNNNVRLLSTALLLIVRQRSGMQSAKL